MQEYCHRCGGDLTGDTQFCPHCGAPQLTLALEQQSDQQSAGTADTRPGDTAATTGAAPPPMLRAVDWRVAIRYAALVALVGAALCVATVKVDALSLPAMLWLASAAMITIGLYQRRLPAARIDAGIGARIGLVVGLCLALGLAASMVGWGLVERYLLHGMGTFDAAVTQSMLQGQQFSQQWLTAHSMPTTPQMAAFERSPEYRATYILTECAMLAALLMAVSAIGGAFGGLLRARRR